jgi:hypothetical protein
MHEENGFEVSIADKSAHVTMTSIGLMFAVDRCDVPAAWAQRIDVYQLRIELVATIVRRMSAGVLEELFREISSQRQCAFRDGESSARHQMRKALGL